MECDNSDIRRDRRSLEVFAKKVIYICAWWAGGLRVRMFRVFDVAGRDKPARPPPLQVRLSRVRWRAGGLAGCRYECDVALNWRGTGLGAHGYECFVCLMSRVATSRRGRRPFN